MYCIYVHTQLYPHIHTTCTHSHVHIHTHTHTRARACAHTHNAYFVPSDSLSVVEQVLSAAQRPGQIELEVHSSNLLSVVKNGVEESLYQLQAFIEPSVDFCNRPQFREEFCIGYVRIGVVMHFIGHLLEKAAVSPSGVPETWD